ncbi:hypothetical protein LTR53_006167 [Teratosphaeriaceae sp. CCFEE 6253]|nr:hypothetical protein LTR53_006167 [Teratosphaeriaceae sp. CCFEE 6253]
MPPSTTLMHSQTTAVYAAATRRPLASSMIDPRPVAFPMPLAGSHSGRPSPSPPQLADQSPTAKAVLERVPPGSDHLGDDGEADQEAFYRHYLTREMPVGKFIPCRDLLDLDPKAARLSMPPSLQADPLAAFDDMGSSMSTAHSCLRAYIVKAYHLNTRDRLREVLTKDQAGTRALIWFFKSGACKVDATLYSRPRFYEALMFCLTAEHADNYIWEWIKIKGDLQSGVADERTYRGNVLKCMTQAQAFWADPDSPLCNSLHSFDRATKMPACREPGSFLELVQTSVWLRKMFYTDAGGKVSEEQFRLFQEQWPEFSTNSVMRDYTSLCLALAGPSSDPLPVLNFWKATEKCNATLASLKPFTRDAGLSLYRDLLRLAQRLEEVHKAGEARWVLDLGRRLLPSVFVGPGVPHAMRVQQLPRYAPALPDITGHGTSTDAAMAEQ